MFRSDGEVWTITYGGRTIRLRNAKGLRYLERLLRRPGRGLHVADLVVDARPPDPAPAKRESKGASARTLAGLGHAGKLLDARARAEYFERLRDVRGELSEAVEKRDIGWAESLRSEADHIETELCAAYGLFGRPRSAADLTERMRKAVTNRIRWSIRRIGQHHPALRRHLEASVRTGIVCSYVPERPVPWRW